MDRTPLSELNNAIAGCERCPARLIEYNWLPVSYFGNYAQANAWVVSINPSHREFVDAQRRLLRGAGTQRFATLADDPTCGTRKAFADQHLPDILDRQNHYYERNPYRSFFNKLGAFLLKVHQTESGEPLTPFLQPLPDGTLYTHTLILPNAPRRSYGMSYHRKIAP